MNLFSKNHRKELDTQMKIGHNFASQPASQPASQQRSVEQSGDSASFCVNKNRADKSISRREKQDSFSSGFFNVRKRRRGKGALIRTAVTMLVLCAMILSKVPYSLMQAVEVGDIPMEVYAADTAQNISLGASALAPVMTSVKDSYDYDTKERVTTAQTVYYGSSGSQAWYVIGYNGTGAVKIADTVTLLAKDILKSGQAYHNPSNENDRSNKYATSHIKPVVDGYYETLFTDNEKTVIKRRELNTGSYSASPSSFCDGISGSALTGNSAPYLWLLSTKEADLVCQSYRRTLNGGPNVNYYWWLRSPGDYDPDGPTAALVLNYGQIDFDGFFVYREYGVRPAFNINLSSILLTSAATGGKSSGIIGADSLVTVGSNDSGEWKLTLKDDGSTGSIGNGHAGFTASRADSGNVLAGENIKINYSGGQTGENEYVSVFLKDSEGKIVYYGHLAEQSASAEEAPLTIPSDITPGTYTVGVFAEQCNGDNKTDYGSAISTFDITVVTHTHNFTYSADADTITATCSNGDGHCTLDDGTGAPKVSFTIAKPDLTTYGGSESASATLTGLSDFNAATGLSVAESAIMYEGRDGTTYAANTTAPTKAGKYTASITVQGQTATVNYEIAKKELTIKADDKSKNYGEVDPTFTATVTGFAAGDTEDNTRLAYSFSREAGEGAGTYTITPSGARDSYGNYSYKYETGTFTINGRPITIKADNQTITYGETISVEPDEVSVTSGSLIDGHAITDITLTPGGGTDVTTSGTVTPSAAVIMDNISGSDMTSAYSITYEAGNLTITEADPAYTTEPVAKTDLAYNGTQLSIINGGTTNDGIIKYKVEAIAPSDSGGSIPADEFGPTDFSDSMPYATKAGTYRVTYYIAGDSNHNDSAQRRTIEVTIAKGTPDIGAVTADDLVDTTDVSRVNLNRGKTSIPGTLSLKNVTTLVYGDNTCTYEFVPTDTANYKNAIGTVSVFVKDTESPTGNISIKENTWSSFLSSITFNLYKRTDSVTITGTDARSGIGSISYYIHESETGMTEDAVKNLSDSSWTAYSSPFNVSHDTKCIIYARITDKQGNKVYISSDGLIIDGTPPAITGATNGARYANGTTINISVSDESGLDSVTVNGAAKTLTGDTYTQTISGAGSYTITATDKAGNKSTLTFRINSPGGSSDSDDSGGGSSDDSDDNPSGSGNKPSDKGSTNNKKAPDDTKNNNPKAGEPGNSGRKTDKKSDDITSPDEVDSANAPDDDILDTQDTDGKPDGGTGVTVPTQTFDGERIYFNEERKTDYGNGTVIISVDVEDKDGTRTNYSGSIVGDTESIMRAVLTQDDINAVASGETVWIRLVVTLISEDVPEADREQIEAALTTIADKELIPGTYYDLSVMKSVGNGDWEYLTTLYDDIEITLDIDKGLQADGRIFYILRSHEGAVTMLFDLDEEPDTITISSRYFSTYALVYTDSPDMAEPVSEKHNCFMHWFILAAALIGEILALLLRRHEDKKKLLIGTECVDIVIMLALAIIGSCMWDWIIFAIGAAAIGVTVFLPHES